MSSTRQLKENPGRTLVDALYEHLVDRPEEPAYVGLSSLGELQTAFTYRELISRSESVAASLLVCCSPGDRAVLLFHGGPEFIVSFLGCLIAGVIAVPGYPVRVPTSPSRPARNFERLIPVVANATPKVALSTRPVVDRRHELGSAEPAFADLHWVAVEELPERSLDQRRRPAPDDIALLQYTSGSTSTPRGVIVSHGNLMSVFTDMQRAWPHDESSVMIAWVPVFHDMGLIHGLLYPLFSGFPVYSLAAAAVLQHPRLWLKTISRYRGTHSAGPNFIFDLCLRRISGDDLKGLDLSSLRACLTGAEAVRHRTLRRFREVFAPCGLRPDAIQPGYGLAEFTLTVTGFDVGQVPKTVHLDAEACERGRVVQVEREAEGLARSFVSCGWTHIDTDIRIVDPETRRECAPDEIGEIWARGANMARGYWHNPQASRAVMGARLHDGSGPFLRTGDLGFVVDGEIYIAGRLKDLIIIRGRNIFPHDIEATAHEAMPEVRVGRCCAFSIDHEEGEALVVVGEVGRVQRHSLDADEAFARLREAVSIHNEAEVYDAVLVRTGTFPLTSSGKVQRRRARQEYLEGKLQAVARMREDEAGEASDEGLCPRRLSQVREWLTDYLAATLKRPADTLSPVRPFESFGMDSLAMIEMVSALEDFAGLTMDTGTVLDYPTIEQLSEHVVRSAKPEEMPPAVDAFESVGEQDLRAVEGR